MIHLHVRDLLQNCGAPPCCTIPAQSRSAKNERSGADRGASGEDELWFASLDFISDGDAGAVCFYHGSHYHACSHHPPGLRTGRQWDMAGICIGDGSGVAGGVMHRSVCPPLILAWLALYLCVDDSAAVA